MSSAIDVIGGVTYLQMSVLTDQLALEMEATSNVANKGLLIPILASDTVASPAPVPSSAISAPSTISLINSSTTPSKTSEKKSSISGTSKAEKVPTHSKSEIVAQPLPKDEKSEVIAAVSSKVVKAIVPIKAVPTAVTESSAIPMVAVVLHEKANLNSAEKVHVSISSINNPIIIESEVITTEAVLTDINKDEKRDYEKKGRGDGRGRGKSGRAPYIARSPIVSDPAEVKGQNSPTAQFPTDVSTGDAVRGGRGPYGGRGAYEGRGEGRGGYEGRGRTSDGRGRGSYEGRGEGRGGYEGRGRTSDGRGRGSYEGRGEGRGGYEGRGRALTASDQQARVSTTDTVIGESTTLAGKSIHATPGGQKGNLISTTDNHGDQMLVKSRGLQSKNSDVVVPSPVANQSTGPTGGSKSVNPTNAPGGSRPNTTFENAQSSQMQSRPIGNPSAPTQLIHNSSVPSNGPNIIRNPTHPSSSTFRGRGDGRGNYPNMSSRGGRSGSGGNNSGRGDSGPGTGRGVPSRTMNPLGNPQAPYGGVPAPKIGVHLLSASSGPAANNSSGMS